MGPTGVAIPSPPFRGPPGGYAELSCWQTSCKHDGSKLCKFQAAKRSTCKPARQTGQVMIGKSTLSICNHQITLHLVGSGVLTALISIMCRVPFQQLRNHFKICSTISKVDNKILLGPSGQCTRLGRLGRTRPVQVLKGIPCRPQSRVESPCHPLRSPFPGLGLSSGDLHQHRGPTLRRLRCRPLRPASREVKGSTRNQGQARVLQHCRKVSKGAAL